MAEDTAAAEPQQPETASGEGDHSTGSGPDPDQQ
jgi:hypothetical protein